jgi:pimeloyl-ACP methyl ester carboxylesterase
LRHLIVQIPGIGGSVLTDPADREAWNVTAQKLTRAVVRPEALDLDRFPTLVPDRLIATTTVIPPVAVVPGYNGLPDAVRNHFGTGLTVVNFREGEPMPSGVDVLRVPYDFRRSVREAAGVVDRAVSATGARSVVVVAHSMGGLVARYWIGRLGGWAKCLALITLGTPHRGAPKALDWLVNGAGLGPFRLPRTTRVLRGWPSVYELVPQYPAIWHGTAPVEPVDLPASCVRSFGDTSAADRVMVGIRAASRTHAEIAEGWAAIPPDRVPVVIPYFGRGHRTANWAGFERGRLRVTTDDPEWRGVVGWRGDGTVPAISAIPAELNRSKELWRGVPDRHGPLGGTPAVLDPLVNLLADDLPARGDAMPDRPWIGFGLEDTVPTGTELPWGVELLGEVDGPGASATATISDGDEPRVVPMTTRGQGWEARLPALPAGMYEVTVQVNNAWHGAPVYGSMPLAVVDPDDDLMPDEEVS